MKPYPSDRQMDVGSRAVVDLALVAFGPEWLRWTPDVNCALAEHAWNGLARGPRPPLPRLPDPATHELLALLCAERRTRWPALDCRVRDLAAQREGMTLVFTFDLAFEGCESPRPARVLVDLLVAK